MERYISERNDRGLFYVTPANKSGTLYDVLYIGLDHIEDVFWSWKVKVPAESEEDFLTTIKYIIDDPDYDEEGQSLYGYQSYDELIEELKLPEEVAREFRDKLSSVKRKS